MKPYNPLEKENLGKSVADSLIMQMPVTLGAIERFSGAGIYAIYYMGKSMRSFKTYRGSNPASYWRILGFIQRTTSS